MAGTLEARPLFSIGLAAMVYSCFALQDALVKWLVESYAVPQILFVRSAVIVLITSILAHRYRHPSILKSKYRGTVVVRAALMLTAWMLFYSSARYLGLAELTTLYFSAPIMVMVLSIFVLKEKVGAGRWIACAVGFVGVVIAGHLSAPVNFIVHSYEEVNSLLAQGWPFFVDIARDGIMLYEASGHPLASPKNLTPEETRAEAQKHFDHWFPSATYCVRQAEYAFQDQQLTHAAFQLHQAAERFYHCVLNVISLYSPKSHKLTFLRSQAEQIAPELSAVWPVDTKFAKRCFSRLDRAYVDARYSPAYEIDDEELAWLTERVKLLQDAVLDVCERALKAPV